MSRSFTKQDPCAFQASEFNDTVYGQCSTTLGCFNQDQIPFALGAFALHTEVLSLTLSVSLEMKNGYVVR